MQVGRDDVARGRSQSGICRRTTHGRATGVCTQVDHVEVVESVDCRPVRSPDYVFKILGFGAEPGAVDPNDPAWGPSSSLNGMYAEVLAAMAEHLGLRLDRVDTEHRVFPAATDLNVLRG